MRYYLIYFFCGLAGLIACQSSGGSAASNPANESGPKADITEEVKQPEVNTGKIDEAREQDAEKGLLSFVDGNFRATDTLGGAQQSISYRFKGEVNQDVVVQLSSAKGVVFEVIDGFGERIADERTSFSFVLTSTGIHEVSVKRKDGSVNAPYVLYVSRL